MYITAKFDFLSSSICIAIWFCKKIKMPLCILDYFTYSNNVYDTRQCDKMLFVKQTRTQKGE